MAQNEPFFLSQHLKFNTYYDESVSRLQVILSKSIGVFMIQLHKTYFLRFFILGALILFTDNVYGKCTRFTDPATNKVGYRASDGTVEMVGGAGQSFAQQMCDANERTSNLRAAQGGSKNSVVSGTITGGNSAPLSPAEPTTKPSKAPPVHEDSEATESSDENKELLTDKEFLDIINRMSQASCKLDHPVEYCKENVPLDMSREQTIDYFCDDRRCTILREPMCRKPCEGRFSDKMDLVFCKKVKTLCGDD